MRHTFFCLLALSGFLAAPLLRAQSNEPADHFLTGYSAYQKGEKAESAHNYRVAAAAYKQAGTALDVVASRWPNWNPPIVTYRRTRAAEGAARVQPLIGKAGDKSTEEEIAGRLPGTGEELPLLPDDLPASDRNAAPGNAPRRTAAGGDPVQEI